eukprot:4727559-Pyramimonas_sp.AAC.1
MIHTPLSKLVGFQAAEVSARYSALLDNSQLEARTGLAPVFELIPAQYGHDVRELVVGLVLLQAAQWNMRFTVPCESFPLLLLRMVEEPPD